MAFHVPQDGPGLANLYGGARQARRQARRVLRHAGDRAHSPARTAGSSTRCSRRATCGWASTGTATSRRTTSSTCTTTPASRGRRRQKVREALSRLYLGSEIGQGYPGDEDNGEMSAWYVFSALGFYPLQMGSPYYAIGSPLFTKATVHLENGKDLVDQRRRTTAPATSTCRALKVNGKTYDKTYLPHDLLANGGTLEFTMGAKPSSWGTGADAAPPSHHAEQPAAGPLARRDRRGRRRSRRGRPVRQQLGHAGHTPRRQPVGPVPLRRRTAGGELLHAHLGQRKRGRGSERVGARGLHKWSTVDGPRPAQRRGVPVAVADPAVQDSQPRRVHRLPARG